MKPDTDLFSDIKITSTTPTETTIWEIETYRGWSNRNGIRKHLDNSRFGDILSAMIGDVTLTYTFLAGYSTNRDRSKFRLPLNQYSCTKTRNPRNGPHKLYRY